MLALARSTRVAAVAASRATVAGVTGRRSLATLTPETLRGLETRWVRLPECEKGAISDALAERARGDWSKLTLDEKRALYWISYGQFYARNPTSPEKWPRIAFWVGAGVAGSLALYYTWNYFFTRPLRTRTPEWKEATKQLAIERKQNPYSGAYSEVLKKEESK